MSDKAALFASQYSMGQETVHDENLSLTSKCSSEEVITHSMLEHSTLSNPNPSEEEKDAIASLFKISGKSSRAESKESNDGNSMAPDVEAGEAITMTRNAQWEYAIDADGVSTFEALWKKRAATDADQPQCHFYNGKNNTDMISLRALSKQGLQKESELSRNNKLSATTTKPTHKGYLHYTAKQPWQLTNEDRYENNPAVAPKAELTNQDEEKIMMELKEAENERKDDEESRALVRLSSFPPCQVTVYS